MGSAVIGCGKALPALEVENDDLRAIVDTNDEWIRTRTGIGSRHLAVSETNTDLAERASRAALGWTDEGWCPDAVDPQSIDLVIVATISSDTIVPSQASVLRQRLGLPHAIAFDLNAACTGFIYAMTVADSMMAACSPAVVGHAGRNPVRRALVVGTELLSRITNWEDRSTCVLFGDGAGAAVLEYRPGDEGLLASFIRNDDDETGALTCPHSYEAAVPEALCAAAGHAPEAPAARAEGAGEGEAPEGRAMQAIGMNGQRVFRFASEAMASAVAEVLERGGVSLADVSCIVPHQANERIIRYAAKKLGLPMDRFQLSIENVGNTSSASVPMALADAYTSGRISPGDYVILVGFGGGFTSGAVLLRA